MLNLTKQEREVILFLIAIAVMGIGVNFFAKKNPRVRTLIYSDQALGRININTADKDLFITVPGIGEKLAARILEYRSQNNGFVKIEELRNVKGISGNKYEKIKELFIVK